MVSGRLASWFGACLVLGGSVCAATPAPAGAAISKRATAITYAPPSNADEPLNERFRGINWTRNGDNFTPGNLLQDGLSPSDGYGTVYRKATQILTGLKKSLHVNTVRLALNEATAEGPWWTEYGAVVRAATDLGMNVMLGFWSPSNSSHGSVVPCADGTFNGCYPVPDYAPWWAMWSKVIRAYASYPNVYLQPFNEAAGYSDATTGYEGPSPTQLANVDAAWLARYPRFPRGRVILGGSGGDYYLTLGHDPRLAGTLLSYHPYCSFGLHLPRMESSGTSPGGRLAESPASFPTEADWTRWIAGQIAGNESRTVITEFGLAEGGTNYNGYRDGQNCVSYAYAVTDYARARHVGLVYWDFENSDPWTIATRTGAGTAGSPYVTHLVNRSFVDRLEWGFGLDRPLTPTVSSAAGTTFYTRAAAANADAGSDRFTVETTGYPAARLTAASPGHQGGRGLPPGISFTDNGDGTGTLSGTPGRLVPGTYPVVLTARNGHGSSSRTFTLTVAAGPPPPPRTGVIAGRITDASGQPLAGVCAHVFLAAPLSHYHGPSYASATYQACSGSDGTYAIPRVVPGAGRYDVQFIDSGARYEPHWHGERIGPRTSAEKGYDHPGTPVSVTAGATTLADATMRPIPSGITVNPPKRPGLPVTGTITVTNDNNVPLTGVTVSDSVNDRSARCSVTGGSGVTIAASPSYPAAPTTATFPFTCVYQGAPAQSAETDTATVTWTPNPHVPGDSARYAQPFGPFPSRYSPNAPQG